MDTGRAESGLELAGGYGHCVNIDLAGGVCMTDTEGDIACKHSQSCKKEGKCTFNVDSCESQ